MSPTVRVGPEPSPEGKKPQRYTVEELAEHSGLTPRTIRSYQTQGILSPPEHRGRVAYYSESHLQRLRAIADLKERGLSLAEIRDVIRRREAEERSAARSHPRSQPGSVGERSRPRHEVGAAPSAPSPSQQHQSPEVAVSSSEASEPGRRGGLLTAMTVLLVLAVATGATFVVLDVRHDNAERKRLSREVSDLRGQLARLGNSPPTPSTTAMPPSSAPPSPPPPVPTTVASPPVAPSPRTPARTAPTVVVTPPAPAPTAPAPPAPPTCPTVSILNLCI